jgi:hypothetical protein
MTRVAVLRGLVRTVIVRTSAAASSALRASTAAHGPLEACARLIGNARAGRLPLLLCTGGVQSLGSFVLSFVSGFLLARLFAFVFTCVLAFMKFGVLFSVLSAFHFVGFCVFG